MEESLYVFLKNNDPTVIRIFIGQRKRRNCIEQAACQLHEQNYAYSMPACENASIYNTQRHKRTFRFFAGSGHAAVGAPPACAAAELRLLVIRFRASPVRAVRTVNRCGGTNGGTLCCAIADMER